MNLSGLAKGAQEYCRVRITAGAISAACIAVILIIVAFMLPSRMGDTSKYVSTNGTIASGTVKTGSKPSVFQARFLVSYEVGGKTYTTTQQYAKVFDSAEQTKDYINSQIGQDRKILYNPANPIQTTVSINVENKLSWISVACAVLIAGWAVFSYMFRDNPIFCGGTILSDTVSIFSSN